MGTALLSQVGSVGDAQIQKDLVNSLGEKDQDKRVFSIFFAYRLKIVLIAQPLSPSDTRAVNRVVEEEDEIGEILRGPTERGPL
jgi:hypothetical protein